jgi:hypothetical protein
MRGSEFSRGSDVAQVRAVRAPGADAHGRLRSLLAALGTANLRLFRWGERARRSATGASWSCCRSTPSTPAGHRRSVGRPECGCFLRRSDRWRPVRSSTGTHVATSSSGARFLRAGPPRGAGSPRCRRRPAVGRPWRWSRSVQPRLARAQAGAVRAAARPDANAAASRGRQCRAEPDRRRRLPCRRAAGCHRGSSDALRSRLRDERRAVRRRAFSYCSNRLGPSPQATRERVAARLTGRASSWPRCADRLQLHAGQTREGRDAVRRPGPISQIGGASGRRTTERSTRLTTMASSA